MSWRTDKIVDVCIDLEYDLPRAKRALVAARRSGRDKMFNGYLGVKRIKLEVAKPAIALLDRITKK